MKAKLILKNEGGFEAGYEPTYRVVEVDIPGMTALEAMSTTIIGGEWMARTKWIYHVDRPQEFPYECGNCHERFDTIINPATGFFINRCPKCGSGMDNSMIDMTFDNAINAEG